MVSLISLRTLEDIIRGMKTNQSIIFDDAKIIIVILATEIKFFYFKILLNR